MTTQNTNIVAPSPAIVVPVTPTVTPETPVNAPETTVAPVKAEPPKPVTMERNGITFTVKRAEALRTTEGEDATVYWTLDVTQFDIPAVAEVKDKDGNVITAKRDADTLAVWRTLDTLLTHDHMMDKLQSKLNNDCRAIQMGKEGKKVKDNLTMDEKLEKLRDYVANGFGANRTFGGITQAAHNAVKGLAADAAAMLTELATLSGEMIKPDTTAERRMAIITRIGQITVEKAQLDARAATLK